MTPEQLQQAINCAREHVVGCSDDADPCRANRHLEELRIVQRALAVLALSEKLEGRIPESLEGAISMVEGMSGKGEDQS